MASYFDLISMGGGVTIISKHSLGDVTIRSHWSNPWVANVNHDRDQEINAN